MSDEFTIDAKYKASNLVAEHEQFRKENEQLRALCHEATPFLGAFGMSPEKEARWHRRFERVVSRSIAAREVEDA